MNAGSFISSHRPSIDPCEIGAVTAAARLNESPGYESAGFRLTGVSLTFRKVL
jgi:hypothetical protein